MLVSRVEVIGNCTLYLGDMRNVVPNITRVDATITDLPYRLESGGKYTGEMGGKFSKSKYDNSGKITKCDISFDEVMPIIAEVMPLGHAYFMVNNRHVKNAIDTAIKAGLHFHNFLVWDKGTGTPNRWYMKNCEFTVFVSNGKAFSINDCGSRQLIKCPNILNSYHENEKPVALMEHYVSNSTRKGETVLDPFMGVGSTGVACANTGRNFIGVELIERYFDKAYRRIESAYKTPSLYLEAGYAHN